MHRPLTVSLAGLAMIAASPAAYAQQDDRAMEAVQSELSAMRAAMDAMNARIEELEGELARTRSAAANEAVPAEAVPTERADIAVAQAAAAPAEEAPQTTIAWNGGPELSHPDGWSFGVSGRLNYDAAYIDAPKSTGRDEGFSSGARRLRVEFEGEVPGNFGYDLGIEVGSGEAVVMDATISHRSGPVTFMVGQHNTFQSMEELSSSLHTSFIERAAFTDAFVFERRVGVSAQYFEDDFVVQGGLFTDNIEALDNRNEGGDLRIAYTPKAGNTQLHVGGSVHYTDLDGLTENLRYSQRPLARPPRTRFVDTGVFSADSETGIGAEAAAIFGRLHVAGEAFWQHVERTDFADPTFFGGYAEIGYFLTPGDRRGYKKGVFERIRPANPLNEGGFGALQFNLRYDYLDLQEADITGGEQNLYGASLVWTPTDHTRLLMNYAYIDYDNAVFATASGDTDYGVHSLSARAQLDF
ncbi:MAG: hypothetical protein CL820_08910 [Croceicoccus sp.]|nr:hypothetical protein [Croceicoccus sp.]MAL25994.1 hypothetical protein [Croceicoccus sp.]|tara:strand:- start:27548 stop:28954 length:1407 start_codon:yes stop_codon:yes gene_type:complete